MKCTDCGRKFIDDFEYDLHKEFCFHYKYRQLYETEIPKYVVEIVTKLSDVLYINRSRIMNINKIDILKKIIITQKKTLQNDTQYCINYIELYKYINSQVINEFSYYDLIKILSDFLHITSDHIINIINIYFKCRDELISLFV